MPFVEPSPGFTVRLDRRLRGIDEARYLKQQSALSGALVTIALASLIALAAWSPVFRSATEEVSRLSSVEPDAATRSGDDWRSAAGLSPYLRPGVSPPPSMTAAFPGPYSPLVIEPPAVGRWSAGRTLLTAYVSE
jgi:hypothetical protein